MDRFEEWRSDFLRERKNNVERDAEAPSLPPADDAEPDAPGGLVRAYQGEAARPQIQAARRSLDGALEAWWRQNTIPPKSVLRSGLLVLEAGHSVEESHRTLLLRTALHHGRGILTALAHQTDPERTAVLLAEALLRPERPLGVHELAGLQLDDERSEQWAPALVRELGQARQWAGPDEQTRLTELIRVLEAGPQPNASHLPARWDTMEAAATPAWTRLRWAILVGLLALLAGLYLWQRQAAADAGVLVPAGDYLVTLPGGEQGAISMGAFQIDHTEVTNRRYRRCLETGPCPWPAANDTATRRNYFLDPLYDGYPVVNVDVEAAATYCAWHGKRLPTEAEWEVAAGYAPATERYFRYPWGDRFELRYANSALNEPADTQLVGHYRPSGESPWGVADMAGNVAEWTIAATAGEPARYVVKGGSYRDAPEALSVHARLLREGDAPAAWIGFRCVRSIQ